MFRRIYNSLEIKKAIECYDRVKSYRVASLVTGISKSTIHRWYKTFHSLVVRHSIQKRKNKRRLSYFPTDFRQPCRRPEESYKPANEGYESCSVHFQNQI